MAAREVYRAFSELIAGPVEELYAEIDGSEDLNDDLKAELTEAVDTVATELYVAKKALHQLLTQD